MKPDTLIVPRFLVPVEPRSVVLTDHAVAVCGTQITAVLPADEAFEKWPQAQRISLGEHALLPGFVNLHTHTPMSLLRGIADDLELYTWLREHIWPVESRCVSPEFVRAGSELAIAEMIRCGTTCFNDFYFFPDVTARVARETGMRACIGLPLFEQETVWAKDIASYFERGAKVMEEAGGGELIQFSWAPHAPYSVGDSTLGAIADDCATTGLRVHIHCLETEFDVQHSLDEHGIRPMERLDRFGLVNDHLIAVHMTQLQDDDIGMLAERKANVVHCPQSNLKLASGFCPVGALVEQGVNVGIGTDGAASNNNLDLLEEARSGSLLAKAVSGDAAVINAAQTIEMMTINGARALGLEGEIGTIEAGKSADLCAFDLSHVQTQPLFDVISQIAYAASSDQCTDVWVQGRRVLAGRELQTVDEAAVLAATTEWGKRISRISESREDAVH